MNRLFFSNSLLFASLVFISLQFFAIPVRSTLVDISVVLYCMYFFSTRLRNIKLFAIAFSCFIFYGIFVDALWQLSIPWYRILSSSFFFSFLASIYTLGKRLSFINIHLISRAIEYSSLLAFGSLFFYLLGLNPFDRSGIFFSERSFASLFYCSSLAYFTSKLYFLRNKFSYSGICCIVFCVLNALGIVLFSSVHPLSLITTISIIALAPFYKELSILLKTLSLTFKSFWLFVSASFLFCLSTFYLFSSQHFTDRFFSTLGYANNNNLSAIVYLRSIYQLRSSLMICPITGCGPGSPGFIGLNLSNHISSLTSSATYQYSALSLNVHDLYSLLMRTIFEFGPILGMLIVILFVFRFARSINILYCEMISYDSPDFKKDESLHFTSDSSLSSTFSVVLWCFVFLIGSLLKEPHLFRSHTFVPIALGLHLCGNVIKAHGALSLTRN